MKTLFLALIILAAGCGNMNSVTKNDSTTNHKKACSCPGEKMECCMKNPDGTTPCSKDECNCNVSAMAVMEPTVSKSGSCCKE